MDVLSTYVYGGVVSMLKNNIYVPIFGASKKRATFYRRGGIREMLVIESEDQ